MCEARFRDPDTLVVGLVNNMADASLRLTERAYRELLNAASPKRNLLLQVFTLPEIERGDAARTYIAQHYHPISALWNARLDGLIVTGCEPSASYLPDEPQWGALVRLLNWAEEHTASTIWSSVAGQAAVLYLDGIERRRLREKLCGVFPCKKTGDHPLLQGMRSRWLAPHSREYEIPQSALVAKGYQVLSHSPDGGADMFAKQRDRSLFVFLQGQPEYDARALFRDFRREVMRYLHREQTVYPAMPQGYLDARTVGELEALRERASHVRDPELMLDLSAIEAQGQFLNAWREPARQLYANWLGHLAEAAVSERTRADSYSYNPTVRMGSMLPIDVSRTASGGGLGRALLRTEW